MKKNLTAALLCLLLCTALLTPAFAAGSGDNSTVTVSVKELKPGYYLCAVWNGDELLVLFDYMVDQDGRLETTVDVGKKLDADQILTVGVSNANVKDSRPVAVQTVKPDSTGTTPINPSPPSSGDSGNRPNGGGSSKRPSGSRKDRDEDPKKHEIVLPQFITGGSVSANLSSASSGTTVTLTVSPNAGYTLSNLSITDSRGNLIPVNSRRNNSYAFTMPNSQVNVSASFILAGNQGAAAAPAAAWSNGFADVPAGMYYYNAVLWASREGIASGTSATTFSPNAVCSRAQMVTFLWRAAGSPAPGSRANPFVDVSDGSYYYDAVLWAVDQGITSGTTATTFEPNKTLTRGQAVTFLYYAAGSPAVNGSNAFNDIPSYRYYVNPVQWAVANGITNGTSATTFSPDDNCTRAQTITFLYHAQIR